MMSPNALLAEISKLVLGLASVVPSSAVPTYISMRKYTKCTIIILVENATTVTGSIITVKQATNVGNTNSDEKALAFTTVKSNLDCGATDTLNDVAVVANTFTTDATNSKNLMYVIEIDGAMLDTANKFTAIRAGIGNATAATVTVLYVLWPAKYGKGTPPSAILD